MPRTRITTAAAVGRGLLAGLIGTAAVTVAGTTGTRRQRNHPLAHWGFGTGLGAARGLLDVVGLGRNVADVAFHGIVWGTEQALLPARVLTHHTAYSLTTNGVYRLVSP